MRHTLLIFLLPVFLLANLKSVFAYEDRLQSFPKNKQKSSQPKSFNPVARDLISQQINLISRIQQALSRPDPNTIRTLGGQLITHTVVVESFIKRQHPYPKDLCNRNQGLSVSVDSVPSLSGKNLEFYCSLYNSTQELSKLTPILDRLLSRRGELAIVRELPLVSGEKQSDLVLPMSPLSRPNLGQQATLYAILEPAIPRNNFLFTGKKTKTAIANYVPPVQPAIKPPQEALRNLKNAEKFLAEAISVLPSTNELQNLKKARAEFDHLADDVNLHEKQIYGKLLSMPNTGIFRVLPHQAYLRPLNTVENRSQKNILGRHPIQAFGEPKGNFTPNLPLQIVKGKFQLLPRGVDYSFMANIGNIPLEDLDTNLQNIDTQKRDIFINYQPPKKLGALLRERQLFITEKHDALSKNLSILNKIDTELNHTYLVRNLQFQLPEIIVNNRPISRKQRRYLNQLLQTQSNDTILAFRPVRRHSDGSYTIIWRVLQQLNDPQIEDLADYLKYQK